MQEPVPLHRVHEEIFRFCADRDDAIIFGAQAVNVFVSDPRMTQDVDILSPDPRQLATELSQALSRELQIATRVREVKPGIGFRVYQKRHEKGRHLADIRLLEFAIDNPTIVERIAYVPLLTLFAMKVIAWSKRRLAPKGATDLADLRRLLLAHRQHLENDSVVIALTELAADARALAAWDELRAAPRVADSDVDEGY